MKLKSACRIAWAGVEVVRQAWKTRYNAIVNNEYNMMGKHNVKEFQREERPKEKDDAYIVRVGSEKGYGRGYRCPGPFF